MEKVLVGICVFIITFVIYLIRHIQGSRMVMKDAIANGQGEFDCSKYGSVVFVWNKDCTNGVVEVSN